MLKNIFMVLFIMFVAAGSSFASGKLFPPHGASAGGGICGSNQVLEWAGADGLKCVGVTANNACSGNSVMIGMSNGSATCQDITSIVKAIVNSCGSTKLYYGTEANVNAGVVSNHANHLNGTSTDLGNFLEKC